MTSFILHFEGYSCLGACSSTHRINSPVQPASQRMLSPHLTWLSRFVWREMSPSSISLAEPHSPKTWHSLHRWKQLRLVVPRAFRRPPLRRPMSTRSNVHPRWVPAKPMLHPRNSLWKLVGDWRGYHQRGGWRWGRRWNDTANTENKA